MIACGTTTLLERIRQDGGADDWVELGFGAEDVFAGSGPVLIRAVPTPGVSIGLAVGMACLARRRRGGQHELEARLQD